jgi:hypothetical protein
VKVGGWFLKKKPNLPRRYRLIMRKLYAVVVILTVVFAIGASAADVALFRGETTRNAGLVVGGWGSGTAVEAKDRVYSGTVSIKVTTQGLHEGGRIDFRNPINLLDQQIDDTCYLQLVLGFTATDRLSVGGAAGGYGIPGSYYSGGQEIVIPARPLVKQIRLVLESEEGKSVEVTAPVPTHEDDGWYRIAIPLRAFGFKAEDKSFRVSRLLIFSDIPDTIFVGQIETIRDNTPITANAGDDLVEWINETLTFKAEAEGGVSVLNYSWNFGDKDSEGEDAAGEIVTHRFTKGGDFKVKLVVSDYWGIKKPATHIINVTIND